MPKEKYYPERKRCKACLKYFGFVAIQRLYCSAACSGGPPETLEAAPRECKVRDAGGWFWKKRYKTWDEAQAAAASRENSYLCSYCHYYHVGTSLARKGIPLT